MIKVSEAPNVHGVVIEVDALSSELTAEQAVDLIHEIRVCLNKQAKAHQEANAGVVKTPEQIAEIKEAEAADAKMRAELDTEATPEASDVSEASDVTSSK